MENTKRKVGIIGLGHVGAHCAYSIAIQGIADELVLVDQNAQKCVSERQDLLDSVTYMPHRVAVTIGDFEDLKDCSILVNATGNIDILRANQDRLDEMEFTIHAVNGYIPRIMDAGFDGIILNITNPCDIVTWQIAKLSQLPRGRVLGTGTGLDTSRLISALSRQTGFDHKSITAYMMGEHGASQMVPWSKVSFGGKSLDAWAQEDPRFQFDREAMKKEAIGAGWVTFRGKFCTEYGISSTAARMVDTILRDEKRIMPASAMLCGEYGQEDLFAGVPVVLGANGAEQVVEFQLPETEQEEFHACCQNIRTYMEHAATIR